MKSSPSFGIGIDTGGTFTDIVLFDLNAGRVKKKAKTPTTHGDYLVCLTKAFAGLSLTTEEHQALERIVLSTTLATNTVAEGKTHPVCLLVEGGDIRVPLNLHHPLVRLSSQISFEATEVVPVSPKEVLQGVAPYAQNVTAFAVSGYASTRNPNHEQQIAQILREAHGKPVVLGSELTHRLNFMDRAQAAALNAGLLPVIVEWLGAVRKMMKTENLNAPLYIVKGDGSLMEEGEALTHPIQTLFSGPAASLQGGAFLSGADRAIIIDVGGTTTDMGWVKKGQGCLKKGGVRINEKQIAVDGLDMATYALGGDSGFIMEGAHKYAFGSKRVLPICRAGDEIPKFSMAHFKTQWAAQWHFGDPALLEIATLDPHLKESHTLPTLTGEETQLAEQLAAGPSTLHALRKPGAALEGPLEGLLTKRVALKIALTPTDVFCAAGQVDAFPQNEAKEALACYAQMLDIPPEELAQKLKTALTAQATELLFLFLGNFDSDTQPGKKLSEQMVGFLTENPPTLTLDSHAPLVLVGAGAKPLFSLVPEPLKSRLICPQHMEVANAVGAITSAFVFRESYSIEPLARKGVELFDHQGKETFPDLAHALKEARKRMEATLNKQAKQRRLKEIQVEITEEIIEEYADLSRRTRKEFVIARIHGTLKGLPA